jgi:hypothetical protein
VFSTGTEKLFVISLAPGPKTAIKGLCNVFFSLEHPARIWCQSSLNQGKVTGSQKWGFATQRKKYLVENTAACNIFLRYEL